MQKLDHKLEVRLNETKIRQENEPQTIDHMWDKIGPAIKLCYANLALVLMNTLPAICNQSCKLQVVNTENNNKQHTFYMFVYLHTLHVHYMF